MNEHTRDTIASAPTLDREAILIYLGDAIGCLEMAEDETRHITRDDVCRTTVTGRLNSAGTAMAAGRDLLSRGAADAGQVTDPAGKLAIVRRWHDNPRAAAEWLQGAIGEQRQRDPDTDTGHISFIDGVLDRLAERGFTLVPTAQVFGAEPGAD